MKIISYSIVIEKEKAIVWLEDSVDELTEEEKEQLASEILSEIYEKVGAENEKIPGRVVGDNLG